MHAPSLLPLGLVRARILRPLAGLFAGVFAAALASTFWPLALALRLAQQNNRTTHTPSPRREKQNARAFPEPFAQAERALLNAVALTRDTHFSKLKAPCKLPHWLSQLRRTISS